MAKTSVTAQFAGKAITFETGELAQRATAAVLGRLGDTVVLVTVVEGGKTDLDYFPLSVDYIERLYAGGKIKGSRWVKRDGRPSDEAVLAGRVIDRSIRPLFPKAFKHAVQIIVQVLSVDGENEADILAVNTVSAALAISRIPWNGPIGAIRMGYSKDTSSLIANPVSSDIATSQLDIIISQTQEKTVMIEAGASEILEDVVSSSVIEAHKETNVIIDLINDLVKKVGQDKLPVPEDTDLTSYKNLLEKSYKKEIETIIASRVAEGGNEETDTLVNQVIDDQKMKNPDEVMDKKLLFSAIEYVQFKLIREDLIKNKKRQDGRKLDEIRPLSATVGILPRTHGSALFERGMTQALTIVTLGSPRMEQLIESADGEETKRYIHHYSGLPYSFGQAGRVGSPGRREIGHGALAERALEAVIPSQKDFPYTIMVVSEVLAQNGSSSMASTCGSTLALMDAGVPITKPVGGISIGMMSDGDDYELLTDIIGLEDFSGDMDFKVAGTDSGITAIQLDVKIPGLTDKQVTEILGRAKSARTDVLKVITSAMEKPREGVSVYAPKIETLQIPVDKIGELIGPGGKNIKNIIAQTGAQVDVEDDGTVTISGVDAEAVKKAYDWVSNMMREVKVGEEFEGPVKRILPFGAFVEILPGKDGMVHVSKMSKEYVNNPEDVVQIDQVVKVRVMEIDDQGRINLTMLLDTPAGEEGNSVPRSSGGSSTGGGFQRERRSFSDRPDRGGDRRPPHPLSEALRRTGGSGDRRSSSLSRSTSSRDGGRSSASTPRRKIHY